MVTVVAIIEVLLIVVAFLKRHDKDMFQVLSLAAEVIVAFAAVAIVLFPQQTATAIYPDLSEYMSDNQTLIDENENLKTSVSEWQDKYSKLEDANTALQRGIKDLEDENADLEQKLKESLIAEITDARLILNGMESSSLLHRNVVLVDGKEFYDSNTINVISGIKPTYDSTQNAIIVGNQTTVTKFSFADVSDILYNGDMYWTYLPSGTSSFSVAGKTYREGFALGCENVLFSYHDGYALFNLEGKYSEMSFDVGKTDDNDIEDVTLTITLDGVVQDSYHLSAETPSVHMSIPLNNADNMKMQVTDGHRVRYGFFNIVFST